MAAGGANRPGIQVRVAVCAADETTRGRLETTLALAGYELALVTGSPDELLDSGPEAGPSLAVLAWAFEPFTETAELNGLRGALGDVPLVLVATGFLGAAYRKLVPEVEGIVHEAQIEEALVATVDAVLSKQLCVPASMRGTLAHPVFSHREKQVLELLLAGLTNGEIAARLYLSESTVKSHLASSFRKLGASSRSEAARCMLAPDSRLELRGLSLANPGPSPVAS